MAIPKPRKPGQTGGNQGQNRNKALSRARGGKPRAMRSSKGCLIWVAAPVVILALAGGTWATQLL